MSVDGQGIAKADKLVVFVKGMIKGEEADVKIIAEKKNYSFGIIDKLIVRSPYRKDLDCPIAYKCGGCDFRHIDYSYQLDLKKEVLINTFRDTRSMTSSDAMILSITAIRFRSRLPITRWVFSASSRMISLNLRIA